MKIYFSFIKSCKEGNIEQAKNIWDNLIETTNNYRADFLHVFNDAIFTQSCHSGKFEVCRWLYEISITINSPFTFIPDDYSCFRLACYNGHTNIAQWLLNLSITNNNMIDIHSENEFAFRTAAANGHFETVKWLYDISIKYDSIINIRAKNDFAFIQSCTNGFTDIAKWLYEKDNSIDIRASNDMAYTWACCYAKTDIAVWLASICPAYKIQLVDGHIDDWSIINQIKESYEFIMNNHNEKAIALLHIDVVEDIAEKEDDICIICRYHDNEYKLILNCDHTVCLSCIIIWYYKSKQYQFQKCPYCTQKISWVDTCCRFNKKLTN